MSSSSAFRPSRDFVIGAATGVVVATVLPYVVAQLRLRRVDDHQNSDCRAQLRNGMQSPQGRRDLGPVYVALCKHLHGTAGGPFDEICEKPLPAEDNSYPHTNLPAPFLADLFAVLRPSFLVEVGSMKGGSALRIADAALIAASGSDQSEHTPCLLCVDTFLGDAGMWLNRNAGWREWLMLDRGLPGLYWQFMANVRRRREVILPLPLASMSAMRALEELVVNGIVPPPEFIYLDAAHTKGETLLEITRTFALLQPGGVLVGDDLDWPAVESDLHAFMKTSPNASGEEDPLLSSLPGVFFQVQGYWVLNSVPRQWILRKCSGSLDASVEALRKTLSDEIAGETVCEFVVMTDEDREAVKIYEEGVAHSEAGRLGSAMPLFKRAAALSPSLAYHFGL